MSELKTAWADKISIWRESGLSMAAWCRENNESYYRFTYWRKRLESKAQNNGRFVELTWSSPSLRLECHGLILHIEHGFDPALLSDVLAVLKTV
jgi:prephenate dehydratase